MRRDDWRDHVLVPPSKSALASSSMLFWRRPLSVRSDFKNIRGGVVRLPYLRLWVLLRYHSGILLYNWRNRSVLVLSNE